MGKAYEVLADGEWRDREAVLFQMYPHVPAGRAIRFAETSRRHSNNGNERERKIVRSEDFLIAVGRRGIAVKSLNDAPRIETKQEDGKTWVRLRPAMHWRTRVRLERESER